MADKEEDELADVVAVVPYGGEPVGIVAPYYGGVHFDWSKSSVMHEACSIMLEEVLSRNAISGVEGVAQFMSQA